MAQPASKPKIAIPKIIVADLRMTNSYTRRQPNSSCLSYLSLSHAQAEPQMNSCRAFYALKVTMPKAGFFEAYQFDHAKTFFWQPGGSRPFLTGRAHEIAFADLHPVVAQDRVGRGGVKEEIRQREAGEVIFALEAARFPAQGDFDVTLFRPIDLAGLELFDVVERFDDACLELVNGRFDVVNFQGIDSRKTRTGILCEIGGDLNLANERKHVGEEPRLEQDCGIEFLRRRIGRPFVEAGGHRAQALQEDRHGRAVHGNRHRGAPGKRGGGIGAVYLGFLGISAAGM